MGFPLSGAGAGARGQAVAPATCAEAASALHLRAKCFRPLRATLGVLLWGWETEEEFCDLAGLGHLENRRDGSETGEYSRYYKSCQKLLEGAQGSASENSCPRCRGGLGR